MSDAQAVNYLTCKYRRFNRASKANYPMLASVLVIMLLHFLKTIPLVVRYFFAHNITRELTRLFAQNRHMRFAIVCAIVWSSTSR
jgi:hypothetical protein